MGCVVYNILDLARKMAKNVMKMEINRSGGFVTLSKIYAGEEDWVKVEMSREVMKLQGVQEEPGFSSLSNLLEIDTYKFPPSDNISVVT